MEIIHYFCAQFVAMWKIAMIIWLMAILLRFLVAMGLFAILQVS